MSGQSVQRTNGYAQIHVDTAGTDEETNTLCDHSVKQQKCQHSKKEAGTTDAQHGITNEMINGWQCYD